MCSNGCKFGACITVDTTKPTCTGERPSNSIILANVGNVSQDWSYSSNTSEYQKCSFKCEAGYLYSNNTCVLPQVTNSNKYTCTDSDGGKDYYKNGVIIQTYNGQPSTLNDSCSQNNVGELTEEYCRPDGSGLIDFERHMCPNGCQYGACLPSTTTTGTATTNVTSNATITCPTYTAPICTDGTLVDGGKDANGCAKASTCVKNTFVCPTYTAPGSNFCVGGQIIDGGTDANGCQKPATCGPKLITGAVTVDGVKDCWFGDVAKKITLGDLIGYQTSPSSGLKYLDEVVLYGATVPTTTSLLSNIFSYEESSWTAADGSTPTNSTQLSNFFILRTYSEGTRTWNIPSNTKFYGCFAR